MLAAIFAVLELFKTRFCYSGGKGTVKCLGFRWLWVTVIQEWVPYSMLCASCGAIVQILFAFCPSCGSNNLRNIHGKDMDELLRYYFQKGFSYKNILLFLSKYHDTEGRSICKADDKSKMSQPSNRNARENHVTRHWEIHLCSDKYICALRNRFVQ